MTVQAEWSDTDLYEVLGVSEDATDKEVQRAYRRLARSNHPDANPGDPSAEERFKRISAAYDVLGDPAKRREYDQLRRLAASGAAPHAGDGPFRVRVGDAADLGDLGDLFGDLLGGARRGRRRRPEGRRGRDLEAELALSFEEAVLGVTTEVHLTSGATCDSCGGVGAAGGALLACPLCGGSGTVSQAQGLFSVRQACPGCHGTGAIAADPCPGCRGTGVVRQPRQVKVRIPAGVDDSQRIRLPGRGEPGRLGGPPGDLYVVARVAPHHLFGRQGPHLTLALPVTYPEAVLGAEVRVPTLDGPPVTVRIPPGTPSGRVLRVRGHGVPGIDGDRGDLLVAVEVEVPEHVGDDERAAIEALARTAHRNPRAHLGV